MQYRDVCTVTSTSPNGKTGAWGEETLTPFGNFQDMLSDGNMSETSFYPRIIRCLGRFLRRARAGGCLQLVRDDEANASSYFGVNVLLAAVVR